MSKTYRRHQSIHKKAGHERWLVSYADFITLLFAFFVVMYALSQMNQSKYSTLIETLSETFSLELVDENFKNIPLTDLARIESQLHTVFQAHLKPPNPGVSIDRSANENWLEITLGSKLLFTSASADLQVQAHELLKSVVDILKPHKRDIQIVGHTDNIPISNKQFSNNWELSALRSLAVLNYLVDEGIPETQLSSVAFGEFKPIADNTTEEGRILNRRVVIRIEKSTLVSSDEIEESMFIEDEIHEADIKVAPTLDTSVIKSPEIKENANSVEALRLKGGDLLFTSDPDLPRIREFEDVNQEGEITSLQEDSNISETDK